MKGALTMANVIIVFLVMFVIVGGGLYYWMGGLPTKKQATGETRQLTGSPCNVEDATLISRNVNAFTGGAVGTNGELFTSSNTPIATDVSVASASTSISTGFPTNTGGYYLSGNDNFQSGTDRGTEYYYTLNSFSNIGCQGVIDLPGGNDIAVYPENTGTTNFRFFEGGTEEATPNVTLGADDESNDEAIWITAPNDQAIGLPGVSKYFSMFPELGLDASRDSGLAVCFNESTSGFFDKIEVLESNKIVANPETLQGLTYLLGCYVIPQTSIMPYTTSSGEVIRDAIVDNKRAVLSIREDTGSTNPGVTGSYRVTLIELCFSVDGDKAGRWTLGWEDTEREGTDSQCGMVTHSGISGFAVNLA